MQPSRAYNNHSDIVIAMGADPGRVTPVADSGGLLGICLARGSRREPPVVLLHAILACARIYTSREPTAATIEELDATRSGTSGPRRSPESPQFPDPIPPGPVPHLRRVAQRHETATCRARPGAARSCEEPPHQVEPAGGRHRRGPLGQTPTRTPRCSFNVTNLPPRRLTPSPSLGWSEPIGCCRCA